MKGWNEANMAGKETITRGLLSACESALDLLEKCATYTREGNLYDHESWTYELRSAIEAAKGEENVV